jgi:ligand-binding sensor domain-containing protein
MSRLFKLSLFFFILCVCLGSPSRIKAQNASILFEAFSIEKGLSQASGFAAAQDQEGFLWFGTQDGLNRFDGYQFLTIRKSADTTQGLLGNTINDVFCDSRGRLWVATTEGVSVKLKGQNKFDIFQPLKGKVLHRIKEDAQGFIWAVTFDSGIYRISPDLTSVNPFFTTGEFAKKMIDITLSPSNELYIATRSALLRWRSEEEKFDILTLKTLLNKTEKEMTIRAFDFDKEGNFWIGGFDNGLFMTKKASNGTFSYVAYQNNNSQLSELTSNSITEVHRASNGDMWIGTRDGLSIFDAKTQTFKGYQHRDNDPMSLSRDYVIVVFEDKQGLFWVGTSGGGFCKVDEAKNRFQWWRRQPTEAMPRVDNMVYAIHQTHDGTLYFGTQNDGLVRYKDEKYTIFKHKTDNPRSIIHNSVNGISESADGRLWLATLGGMACFDPKTELFESFTKSKEDSTVRLFSIHVYKRDNQLLVGGQKGIFKFDITQKKWLAFSPKNPQNNATKGSPIATNSFTGRSFYEEENGDLWIGSEGKGLVFYDKKEDKFSHFDMPAATVRSVLKINKSDKNLWVGTDNGLVCFESDPSEGNMQAGKILKIYNTGNGLLNNVVYGILAEDDKNIWISTNLGLARLNIEKERFDVFDVIDGLQSNEFNTNARFKSKEGALFFGGLNGVTSFFPKKIMPNAHKPPVKITHFKVFDKEITFNEDTTLVLAYSQNFFTLELAALNYSMSHKNIYAYQLEGINPDWIFSKTNRLASYTHLPSGEYVFKARAANNDGVWSDKELRLRIKIEPPFWATWWFRCLALAVLFGLVRWVYLYRISQIKLQANLKEQAAILKQKEAQFSQKIAEMEMSALRSQMNPHFIFNVLNSINNFMLNNNTEEASHYLTKFARLIRLILENSKNEKVPLSSEMNALDIYIQLEALRFKEKIHYDIFVNPDIDQRFVKIPPMLIQPYVENAIWHGLMHRLEGGNIWIRIFQDNERSLTVEVEDDGIGRTASAAMKSKSAIQKKSFGMEITSKRLMVINEMFKTETKIMINDVVNTEGVVCGTKVVLEIPV